MQLKQITIEKYRSIKTPFTFPWNGLSVFIGKNGSGKTNVLRALLYALSRRDDRYVSREAIRGSYRLVLNANEMGKYFPAIGESEYDEDSKSVSVRFDGLGFHGLKLAKCPAITRNVQALRARLKQLAARFKESAADFYAAYEAAVEEEEGVGNFVFLDEKQAETVFQRASQDLNTLHAQIDKYTEALEAYLDENFPSDELSFDVSEGFIPPLPSPPSLFPPCDLLLFHTTFSLSAPARVKEKLHVGDDALAALADDILRARKAVNEKIKKSYSRYEKARAVYHACATELDAFRRRLYNERENRDTAQERKRTDLLASIGRATQFTCYYLDNEQIPRAYGRSSPRFDALYTDNPFFKAMDNFLTAKALYGDGESLLQPKSISPERLEALCKLLNEKFLQPLRPKFEDIKAFVVRAGNDGAQLYISERDGSEVPFDETSLGRRWYLSYRLIASLAKKGDVLLIDEPASFLHPEAQMVIRNDLIALSKRGIHVFYTTHSPFMLPDDWTCIYNVTMTETGTAVSPVRGAEALKDVLVEHLGLNEAYCLLFSLNKHLLLVEGLADKVCVEKFAELLGYDLSDYYIQPCDGDAILLLSATFIKIGYPFRAMLDSDNLHKPQGFQKIRPTYPHSMQLVQAHPEYFVFIGLKSGNGCLEDYFQNDPSLLSSQNGKKKVNHEKILKLTSAEQVSPELRAAFDDVLTRLNIPKIPT